MKTFNLMTMTALASMAMAPTFSAEGGVAFPPDDSQLTDEQFQEPVRTNANANVEGGEAASTAPVTKDVVPPQYREKYKEGNGTCGDFIANEISTITKEGGTASMASIKGENGIPETKWNSLNPGMQRMNLANTLRAAFLRGETIKIGGKEHSLATYFEEFEGTGDDRVETKPDDVKSIDKFLRMVDLQQNDRMRAAITKYLTPKPDKEAKAAEREAAKAKAKEEREAKAKEREETKAKAAEEKEAEKAKAKEARDAEKAKAAEEREAAKAKAKEEREAAKKVADEAKAAAAKTAEPVAAKTTAPKNAKK